MADRRMWKSDTSGAAAVRNDQTKSLEELQAWRQSRQAAPQAPEPDEATLAARAAYEAAREDPRRKQREAEHQARIKAVLARIDAEEVDRFEKHPRRKQRGCAVTRVGRPKGLR